MKPEILVIGALPPSCATALDEAFVTHRLAEAPDPEAFLDRIGPRVRGVATFRGIDAGLMARLPALEIVSSFGVGYDKVDVEAARARRVRVTNTPDVLNDAVAEMTVCVMLALARKLRVAEDYVRTGRWEREGSFPLTAQLAGSRAGIFGLGRIGKEIARRLVAMKVDVAYHGRREQPGETYRYFASLREMAAQVDWLVAIAPATPETIRIVDREVLEALGPEGAFVNLGRGSLVDETALIEALEARMLGGAALDVFADEPRVPERLTRMDNVVLTPHVGSATHRTRHAMGDLLVRNLKAHFSGAPLVSPVA